MKRPALIALAYLAFGVAWIFFSDRLVLQLWGENIEMINKAQAWKGYVFVAISALFILLLIKATYNRIVLRLDQIDTLFAGSDMSIVQVDLEGNIKDAGKQVAHIIGYEPGQLRGQQLTDLIPDSEQSLMIQYLNNLRRESPENEIESLHLYHADGSLIPVKLSGAVRRKRREGDTYVIAVQDITKRRQDEAKIAFQAEMLEAVGQAVIGTDVQGTIIYWNRAAEEIYGWKKEEVMGQPVTTITPTDQTREEAFSIMRDLAKGHIWAGEFEVKDKSGRTFPVYVTDSPVFDEAGNLSAIIGVSKDISARKQAEQQLADSERKYRLIFENTSIPLWIFERSSLRFLEVNQAAVNKYGFSKEEFLAMNVKDIHDADQQPLLDDMSNQLESGSHQEVITRHRTKDGKQIYVNIYSSVIDYFGTEAELVTAIDITNQVDTEREITTAIMRSTEEERSHIAREIHDGLTQTLSIVSLNLKNLIHDFDKLNNSTRFKKAMNYLNEAIDQSRNIAHSLMPKTISDFGLVAAISELIEALSETKSIEIDFTHDINERLDPDLELNLFRITQEALRNVMTHSGADKASINLQKGHGKLHLKISDNGAGFSVEDKLTSGKGIGLRTMHSRAIRLDGILRLNSKEESGTTISIDIPEVALKRK